MAPLSEDPVFESLSKREVEILGLLRAGKATKDIAQTLCLSIGTVRNHISQMLRKTKSNSRLELVVKAQETGFRHGQSPVFRDEAPTGIGTAKKASFKPDGGSE